MAYTELAGNMIREERMNRFGEPETVCEFDFNGARATVILPERPNGEWIWKTEFLRAFDGAERALYREGYTRVYYSVSDRFGSYGSVRMMHLFFRYVTEAFSLRSRCHLFGFSRGGLYAFGFALTYPEYVASVYLDAPVMDVKSWPPKGSRDRDMLFAEMSLNEETLPRFHENPVDRLEEFFSLSLPLMVVAGDADELVPLTENAGILLEYCREKGIEVTSYVKHGCGHHPHSLEDVTPILDFVHRHSAG